MPTLTPTTSSISLAAVVAAITVSVFARTDAFAEAESLRRQVKNYPSLCAYAEAMAESPFKPAPELPAGLQSLDYDDYRLISFWPNEALWRRADTPFQLELFHRGYIFFERVGVNLLTDSRIDPVPFNPSLYEYRGKLYDNLAIPPQTGYAGVKMLGTLPSSPYMREIASFLGASYFRCLSDGQVYGASSRGLGINMGMPQPEEFPCFREFWITKPPPDNSPDGNFDGPPGSGELHFLAFLDSPSLTGAYEFHLRPGDATACDVKARLFYRHPVPKLCIAPTSSMWMWGKGRSAPEGDARPEVHDSDGLLILDCDDRQRWRALAKQSYPSVSAEAVKGLRGFGLMQREHDYARYLDDEAKYHARPSLWVEPLDDNNKPTTWPAGWIELFEMPADHEGYDNIAAWFVPERQGKPGEPFDLHYRVTFMAGDESVTSSARAVDMTRSHDGNLARITLTFEGDAFAKSKFAGTSNTSATFMKTTNESIIGMPERHRGLTADVSALRGSIREVTLAPPQDGCVSLNLGVQFDGDEPVELRAALKYGESQVTETWSYLCPPKP